MNNNIMMNITNIPNDVWINIIQYLLPSTITQLFTTSKYILNIFDGKMLLNVIHVIKLSKNNEYFINNYILSTILKDIDVNNIISKNYEASKFDKILILRSILDCDVYKTILLLKLFGNENIYYNNFNAYKYFPNETKILHYCFDKSKYGKYFVLSSCSMNLHFTYLIFFTPIEFIKQIIPFILNTCEFRISKTPFSTILLQYYVNGIDSFNKKFDDPIPFIYPLQYLIGGYEKFKLLSQFFVSSDNFRNGINIYIENCDDIIPFDKYMDASYVIPKDLYSNFGNFGGCNYSIDRFGDMLTTPIITITLPKCDYNINYDFDD